MIKFRFSTELNSDHSSIVVKDETSYGLSAYERRSDFALALFYSKDGFVTESSYLYYSTDTAFEYSIPAFEDEVYQVAVFVMPIYDDGIAGESWPVDVLVYHDSAIWQCIAATSYNDNDTTIPGSETSAAQHWAEKTTFAQVTAAFNKSILGKDESIEVNSQLLYTYANGGYGRTDVYWHSYIDEINVTVAPSSEANVPETNVTIDGDTVTICDSTTVAETKTATILDLDGNAVGTATVPYSKCGDITVDTDGVYVIIMESTNYYSYTPLYRFTDFMNCYNNMVATILCNESDPCCTNCTEESKEEKRIKRYELNSMMALYNSLISKVQLERATYMGTIEPSTERYAALTEIQSILDKLQEVTSRCGDCNGALPDVTTTTPCSNCG